VLPSDFRFTLGSDSSTPLVLRREVISSDCVCWAENVEEVEEDRAVIVAVSGDGGGGI